MDGGVVNLGSSIMLEFISVGGFSSEFGGVLLTSWAVSVLSFDKSILFSTGNATVSRGGSVLTDTAAVVYRTPLTDVAWSSFRTLFPAFIALKRNTK